MKSHHYNTKLVWKGNTGKGTETYRAYERAHEITVDGKPFIPGSSDPSFRGDPTRYNPEELFLASLSACHMLWFLAIAAKRQYTVDRYADSAVGVMGKNSAGKKYVARVTLRPEVAFSGDRVPDAEDLRALHHRAHEECFIANSVLTEILCEPVATSR